MRRIWIRTAVIASTLGLLAGLVTVLAGVDPLDADIKYDWLSAWGALYSNAHGDGLALAREAGVSIAVNAPPGTEPPFPHPRTPGAILVQMPLLLVQFQYLFALSVGVIVALTALLFLVVAERAQSRWTTAILVLTIASAPLLVSLRFAGQSAIVAVLTLSGWLLYRRRSDIPAAIVLAVAGSLKVFPLILLLPMLLSRRTKPVLYTSAFLVLLNVSGLLLPGVHLADAVEAIAGATGLWLDLAANGSLVRLLAAFGLEPIVAQIAAIAVVGALLVYGHRRRPGELLADPLPWLIAALLMVPLSWVGYDLVLVPAVIVMTRARKPSARRSAGVIWALWVAPVVALPFQVVEVGFTALSARVLLMVAWVAGWLLWDDRRPGWRNLPAGAEMPQVSKPGSR